MEQKVWSSGSSQELEITRQRKGEREAETIKRKLKPQTKQTLKTPKMCKPEAAAVQKKISRDRQKHIVKRIINN